MTPRRWAAAAIAAAIASAAAVLILQHVAQGRAERGFAIRMATTTAAYLAAVTPARRGSSDYDLGRLLTHARALQTLPSWTSRVEVFHGTAPLVDATRPPLSVDELHALRAGPVWRGGVALVALHDRAGREIAGAVAVRPRPLRGRWSLPGGGGGAIPWTLPAALLAIGVAASTAMRRRPLGRYLAAAALLALAAYGDARGAARRSTDRWLADTRALLQEAATRLPAPRARATIEELAAVARGGELVAGEPAESAPRRVRIDGTPRAVVAVLIGPNRWAELRTLPAEHATTGWLLVLTLCALAGPAATVLLRSAEQLATRRALRPAAVAWGLLAPAGFYLVVFSVGPLCLAAYLSVHGAAADSGRSFVGFANYVTMLRDPTTWGALRSTALYALYVPASLVFALAVALVLHRHPRAGLLRALFAVPYAASAVAAAGFGGMVLSSWLASRETALLALMLIAVWSQSGVQILLLLSALEGIPQPYLDMARLEGGGSWGAFRRVTLPLLRPVLGLALVTGIIGAFHSFTAAHVLAGGPDGLTDLVMHRVYRARDTAFALFTGALLLVFMWAQVRIVRTHA